MLFPMLICFNTKSFTSQKTLYLPSVVVQASTLTTCFIISFSSGYGQEIKSPILQHYSLKNEVLFDPGQLVVVL